MEDPKELLRRYFITSDQATSEALDRIEVLTETLRKIVPGFNEEHSRQARLQAERRVEQAKSIDAPSPHRIDQLIETFQQVFGRKE
jgi:hypothetical protein